MRSLKNCGSSARSPVIVRDRFRATAIRGNRPVAARTCSFLSRDSACPRAPLCPDTGRGTCGPPRRRRGSGGRVLCRRADTWRLRGRRPAGRSHLRRPPQGRRLEGGEARHGSVEEGLRARHARGGPRQGPSAHRRDTHGTVAGSGSVGRPVGERRRACTELARVRRSRVHRARACTELGRSPLHAARRGPRLPRNGRRSPLAQRRIRGRTTGARLAGAGGDVLEVPLAAVGA